MTSSGKTSASTLEGLYQTPERYSSRLFRALKWSKWVRDQASFPFKHIGVNIDTLGFKLYVSYEMKRDPGNAGWIPDDFVGFPSPELIASLQLLAGPMDKLIAADMRYNRAAWRRF